MPTVSATMNTVYGALDVDMLQDAVVAEGVRGEADLITTSGMSPKSNVYGVGSYIELDADTTFHAVRWNCGCINRDRDVTLRVWVRNSVGTGFVTTAETPVWQGTVDSANMTHGYGAHTFELGEDITASAGQVVFACWSSTAVSEMGAGVYLANDTGDRQYMQWLHANNALYPAAGGYGLATTYYAPALTLIGTENITRQDVEVYEHLRGDSELDGNVAYGYGSSSANLIAFYDQLSSTDDVTFNVVQCNAWCTDSARDIELHVYARSTADAFYPAYASSLTWTTIAADDMPHSEGEGTFRLPDAVTVPAGYYCYIVFVDTEETSDGALHVAYFNAAGSSPARHAIQYRNVWSGILTSTGAGTYQAGFRLLNATPQNISIADMLGVLPTYTPTADSSLTAEDMQAAIDELAARSTPRVIMPDGLTAVVGDTLQLFLPRGAIEAQDPYQFARVTTCAVGDDLLRYFEYIPEAADVGTDTLTLQVLDPSTCIVISEGKTVITTVEATGQPAANKNILIVGDSLANAGYFPEECRRRLCDAGGTPVGLSYSNLTFIGTQPMTGAATQRFVGNAGWTWSDYIGTGSRKAYRLTSVGHNKDETDMGSIWQDSAGKTWKLIVAVTDAVKLTAYSDSTATMPAAPGTLTHVAGASHTGAISYSVATSENATPFWNSGTSALSFAQFVTDHGASGLDAVYVELGWNGLTPNMYSIVSHATRIEQARTMLDQIHTDFPSAVVRVLGLQVPSVNGGLGDDYGATGSYANYYKLLRSVNGYALALQSLCNEADYSSWCRYLATAIQFDTDYNMPDASKAVNTRNSATEVIGSNGIHPDTEGYYQIADMLFRDVIRTFCAS